jgi:hypothetical protein
VLKYNKTNDNKRNEEIKTMENSNLKNKIYKFYDSETLLFDNVFVEKEDIEYAKKHNFNVKFTEVRSTNTINIIDAFLEKGYELTLDKEEVIMDGMKLNPKITIIFKLKQENKNNEEIKNERN